jgi:hypothetical protein
MSAQNWVLRALLAAAFVVLPVLLRFLVGDDPPNNEIAQEQPGCGDEDEPEPEPAPEMLSPLAVRLAA